MCFSQYKSVLCKSYLNFDLQWLTFKKNSNSLSHLGFFSGYEVHIYRFIFFISFNNRNILLLFYYKKKKKRKKSYCDIIKKKSNNSQSIPFDFSEILSKLYTAKLRLSFTCVNQKYMHSI